MSPRTLVDEFGDTGIVQDRPLTWWQIALFVLYAPRLMARIGRWS